MLTPEEEQARFQQEFADFRTFYGTDKLRELGEKFDELKKTTRFTTYVQLAATAVTPIITIAIALITYQATHSAEAEKNRIERIKLAADLYSKALAQDSASVLLNTAKITTTLLEGNPDDKKLSDVMANNLNMVTRKQSAAPTTKVTGNTTVNEEKLNQQEVAFKQLKRNVSLPKQAISPEADIIAQTARRTLRTAKKSADSLGNLGYKNLLAGRLDSAKHYFNLADYAYPTLYNYRELSSYLARHTSKTRLTPGQLKGTADTILTKYSYGLPSSTRKQLSALAK